MILFRHSALVVAPALLTARSRVAIRALTFVANSPTGGKTPRGFAI
jgi:hypothetical protein